jgi:hypothetical protein
VKHYILIIFLALPLFIYSQETAPVVDWIRAYHSSEAIFTGVRDIIMDSSYNLYIAGGLKGSSRTVSFTLTKISSNGDSLLWFKYKTETSMTDGAGHLQLDSDMNIYAAGSTNYEGSKTYPLLMKYNPAGELLWVDRFSNIADPHAITVDFKLFADNNAVLFYHILDITPRNYSVIKGYSPSGDSLWSITMKDDTSHFQAFYLVRDSSDYIYACIYQNYKLGEQFTATNIILLKINSGGKIIWRKDLGDFVPDKSILDKEHNLILISETGQVKKMNPDGDILWAYFNEDTSVMRIYRNGIADSENNIIVSGYIGNVGKDWDYLTTKISSGGEELWTVNFASTEGLNDHVFDITLDKDDNIYVTGESVDINNVGPCYTVKYSKDGEFLWKYRLHPDNAKTTGAIKVFTDDSNNVYIGGSSTDGTNIGGYVLVKLKQTGSVDVSIDKSNQPAEFALEQNYPNPFNPSTTIRYTVPSESIITIKIYDVLGNEIQTLVNEGKAAGSYVVEFNASNIASGVYICKMTSLSYKSEIKMLVIK